jgi:glutathione synthase/RimK-type ligase-like ATP-grasp enzyme
MILLCGIPSESSLRRVRDELDRQGAPYLMLNQREVEHTDLQCTIVDGQAHGTLGVGSSSWRLEDFGGVLVRMMEDRCLPEIRREPEGSPLRAHSRRIHEGLNRWFEISSARVLNRPGAMASNGSKPYQAQLVAAHGFSFPETLVTTDPDEVRAFRARHGRVVYKSISAVRSIVHCLEDDDLDRLESIRWCPVQFQEHVAGTDLRVHVVGREVFATAIESEYSDYRYAGRDAGKPAELTAATIDDDLAQRCIRLAHGLELPFAGIDLRITPEGRQVCFEVNPSPALSYYEAHTGQPIAAAVARYLRTDAPAPLGAEHALRSWRQPELTGTDRR